MFSFFKSSQPRLIKIEGIDTPIEVNGKETILNAALRQGIGFPHSCRVGGCATCKCRLMEGKVKELTESAYVLSEEELDQGYILACQSVPRSNLSIRLDPVGTANSDAVPRNVSGVVSGQRRLTHDICALTLQLDSPLEYTAGQYALLSVPTVIDEARSYSFATPATKEGTSSIEFFIRQVPGGTMSSWAQGNIVKTPITLQGPFGDFYLRESQQPILCIAGGSGLAPIKALLEEALHCRNPRPVTFLFGARTQADLYCLESIQKLQQQWAGEFNFVPVLSEEPSDSNWTGLRGLVTDVLTQYTQPHAQAYLCGPPAMLDAAETVLQNLGLPQDQIFSDKFLDKSSQFNIA